MAASAFRTGGEEITRFWPPPILGKRLICCMDDLRGAAGRILPADKVQARHIAQMRRKAACIPRNVEASSANLEEYLMSLPHRGAIAGYLPIRSEASPLRAMARAVAQNQPVCVPVVIGDGQPLMFRSWKPGSALKKGAFGVMVPSEGAWISPTVIICPLLAFDRFGYRLGYGGGFYDRTLANRIDNCLAVGLAFDEQECDRVPTGVYDEKLDAVVTESGIREFRNSPEK